MALRSSWSAPAPRAGPPDRADLVELLAVEEVLVPTIVQLAVGVTPARLLRPTNP